MLMDQIVTTHWRLRQALTAAAGEIALSVDGGHHKRTTRNPTLEWLKWTTFGDPIHAMEESSTGLWILTRWLKEVRVEVEKERELTEKAIKIVFVAGKPNSLSENSTNCANGL